MDCFDIVSTVIEGISSLATVAAVIVALCANKKSNEQLIKALEMHEQTKSIELLDKRIILLRNIEADDFSKNLEFQMLFDENIYESFCWLKMLCEQLKGHESDMKKYCEFLQYPLNDNEEDPLLLLQQAQMEANSPQASQDAEQNFENLCKKYERISSPDITESECKVYNYKEISDLISMTNEAICICKSKLIADMKEFIQKSLEPLVKEEEKK